VVPAESETVRAFVLAGGYGSRLSSRLGGQPKILAPFRGRPFLETQVEWLAAAGVDDVVLCLGVAADPVLAHLRSRPPSDVRVTAVREPEPLGTGGAVAFAAAGESQPFLVVNGDTLAAFSLDALWDCHAERAAMVTLVCYRISDASAKGRVEIGDDGLVTAFREKSGGGGAWVSGGIYACEPSLPARIPRGRRVSLETEVFPSLVAAGERVAAWHADGRLYDIGTPAGLDEAEEAWATDSPRSRP